jgi:hypothetical protein
VSFLSTAVQKILEQGPFCAVATQESEPMFPRLGRTPPPWRWPASVFATSIGTHVAYVAGVAWTDAVLPTRES